jgi:hypothetical protein
MQVRQVRVDSQQPVFGSTYVEFSLKSCTRRLYIATVAVLNKFLMDRLDCERSVQDRIHAFPDDPKEALAKLNIRKNLVDVLLRHCHGRVTLQSNRFRDLLALYFELCFTDA